MSDARGDEISNSHIPRPQLWRNVAKWGFAAIAIVLLIYAVLKEWPDFVSAVSRLRFSAIVIAFAFGILASAFNTLSWRGAFGSLGIRLPIAEALRVFLVSQIGKYVPGSVWPVLAQMEMARDRGFSRVKAATASVVSMLVGVVTASVASVLVIFSGGQEALRDYWYVGFIPPVGLLLLAPPILSRLLRILGRVVRRPMESVSLNGGAMLVSILWAMLMWLAFGLHTWTILKDLSPQSSSGIMSSTGAFALAWVVGFLFIVAPAGVGIREAVLVLALGGTLGRPDALAFAIVSRVLLTIVDLVGAGIGLLVPKAKQETGQQESNA